MMLQKMRGREERRRPRASFPPPSFLCTCSQSHFHSHFNFPLRGALMFLSLPTLFMWLLWNSSQCSCYLPILTLYSKTVLNHGFIWSIASRRAQPTWSNCGTVSQMTTFILRRNIGGLEESSKLRWMLTLLSHKKEVLPAMLSCIVKRTGPTNSNINPPDVLHRNRVELGWRCHPYT